MPKELAQFKRIWEHLNGNTLDDLTDANGSVCSEDTLEKYLTPENGVNWQRDHVTIKVIFGEDDSRVIKAQKLLDSWLGIIQAVPKWCLRLVKTPRLRPNSLIPTQGGPFQLLPTHVLTTPRNEWFLIYPHGCYPAHRDWRGRISISGPSVASMPEDAEHAAAWGNGYIHSKRNSFPVAAEFSLEGDDTPLDKLTVKKLTYLISRKGRKPPNCIKNWTETLTPLPRGVAPLDWKAIASLFNNGFLSSKDYHLHYRHIIHRGIVTRHTWPADHGPLCRLCRGADERTFHMGKCPIILKIFDNLKRLDPTIQINNSAEVLFAFPKAGMGTRCLATILWKFILQHFYGITGATAPTNTALIWAKGLRRFAELALRHEAATQKLIRDNLDKDKPAPKASKFNNIIAPLATINSDTRLRWSDEVYEELSRQELKQYISYGRYGYQGSAPA